MEEEIVLSSPEDRGELMLARDPESDVKEAEHAAEVLTKEIFSRIKPPIINGKRYPTVEHWQTLASFYGVIPRVVSTSFVEFGGAGGFEAIAEAVTKDGRVVSRAEAMCLNDEPRWKGRPLHQVRAMAQTRAISRVLRNIFSRIMVLAGCEPTPAEDADGTWDNNKPKPAIQEPQKKAPQPEAKQEAQPEQADARLISEPQQKRLFAIATNAGWKPQELKDFLMREYGIDHSKEIRRDQYEEICQTVESGTNATA